jgi:hypothetical protein
MIFIIYELYKVFSTMNITTTTWRVGQTIIDDTVGIYNVALYKLDGLPVRTITTMYDDSPIGVILHLFGHGDWIYFDNALTYAIKSKIPRILNHCKTYEPEVKEMLSNAKTQASDLMYRINNQEFCTCGELNHGSSRCQTGKYCEM